MKEHKFTYLVGQREKCPETGREHIQGYVEFEHPQRMDAVKKAIGDAGAHLEVRKGTRDQVCCEMLSLTSYPRVPTMGRGPPRPHAEPCCDHFMFPYAS